jgi:N-acetylglucosamine kinase-like BadF-type ATPase
MKIIADCGATKSEWVTIHSDGSTSRFITKGVNASTMSASAIKDIISEAGEKISVAEQSAAEINLYMAGIPSEEIKKTICNSLQHYFPIASLEIHSDLLGAARAACGHEPGIAAIIGTGSNSCMYDGIEITKRVYSCGFILGDEGGAATLGKLFIADFLKGLIPAEIASEFSSRYPSDYATIVANVYKSEGSPSGYLGSFTPFILEHYDNPYIKELVDGNFRSLIRRAIKQYDTDKYAVGVVGGFGFALKDILSRIAEEEGVKISRFIKSPIDGLVEYHR